MKIPTEAREVLARPVKSKYILGDYMKLYEAYEDERTTYLIAAEDEHQAYEVLKKELVREQRDEEEADDFAIDEIDIDKPHIIAINTLEG